MVLLNDFLMLLLPTSIDAPSLKREIPEIIPGFYILNKKF